MHITPRCLSFLLPLALLTCGDGRAPASRVDAPRPPAVDALPAPTEHRLGPSAEDELNDGRREWFERMHRAAPGVDWRAIERENGRRSQERRNALRALELQSGVSPWTEIGSDNQAGRVHCATTGPDPQTLYVGSDRGGVWRGSSAGSGWTPLGDNLFGGSNELVVLPGDTAGAPDVITSMTDGGSVSVSDDDGTTWVPATGTNGISSIRGVAVLKDATSTILFWGRQSGKSKVFASTDKGRSFSVRHQEVQGWDGYLWSPREGAAAANTVYLIHQGVVKRSTNAGATFSTLGTVAGAATAGVLTGSEAGAPTLYAAVSVSGTWELHRSTNGGTSFQKRSNLSDYWGPLCASSATADIVMYGGVEVHRSADGGQGFQIINGWGAYYGSPATKLHADLMGIYCEPDPSSAAETWFFCTDGGLYRSVDQGATVANLSLSGLGISQYYSTHTSRTQSKLLLAGAQDQGYQRGIVQPSSGAGPSTSFDQLISGDYGHLTSSDGSHDYVFSTYPGFILVHEGQGSPKLYQVSFPAATDHDWLPMVVADPQVKTAFFFVGSKLHRYERSLFGPFYASTQYSNQDFGAGAANYATALAFAPSDPQRAYAVNDAGALYYSSDKGVTWTQPQGGAPNQQYFYGNAIAVHPTDKMECVVGGSGYSAAGVIRTTDGGQSWQPLTSGLPATHVYDLAYAEDGSGDIYAAAHSGAYRFDRAAGTWTDILGAFAPLTTYWSVEAVPDLGVVRFGTYGRGVWEHRLPTTCPGAATAYGFGCPGGGGFAPYLEMDGCPSPGQAVTFAVKNGPGGSSAILVFGLSQSFTALPNGCLLQVAPLLPVSITVPLLGSGPGQGSFQINYTVPVTASAGSFTLQGLIPDPLANGGYTVTNGLAVTIL